MRTNGIAFCLPLRKTTFLQIRKNKKLKLMIEITLNNFISILTIQIKYKLHCHLNDKLIELRDINENKIE